MSSYDEVTKQVAWALRIASPLQQRERHTPHHNYGREMFFYSETGHRAVITCDGSLVIDAGYRNFQK